MEKTNNTSALDIAEAYYKNWTSRKFDEAATLLDDSIQFEMPINFYASKSAFIAAVQYTANNATNIHLLSGLGNDVEAILVYDFDFAPIGNMRIAEHFRTNNGKIVFIRHIHDTFQLRNAGFGNDDM